METWVDRKNPRGSLHSHISGDCMCSAHSIIMYSCEQLVVASSLGVVAVSAALVAILCCTRRPPKVGNTPLVLLLVGLLAITATLVAGDNDEPPPRKVSRLLYSPMSPIPVDETEPEDDGEDADDDESPDHWVFPPRADRTNVTLEPAPPGPLEVIEGGRRQQLLRPIPQPRSHQRPLLNTPGDPSYHYHAGSPPQHVKRNLATQHLRQCFHSYQISILLLLPLMHSPRNLEHPSSCPTQHIEGNVFSRIWITSKLFSQFIITIKVDIFQPLEGSCLACQQEAARRRSREFLLDRFLQEHTSVDCDRRALDAMIFLRREFRETLWFLDHLMVNTSEHQILSIAYGMWRSVQVTMETLLVTVGEMMEASRRTAITPKEPELSPPPQRVQCPGPTSKTTKPAILIQYKITLHLDEAPRTSGQRNSFTTLGARVRYPSTPYTFCALIPRYQTAPRSSSLRHQGSGCRVGDDVRGRGLTAILDNITSSRPSRTLSYTPGFTTYRGVIVKEKDITILGDYWTVASSLDIDSYNNLVLALSRLVHDLDINLLKHKIEIPKDEILRVRQGIAQLTLSGRMAQYGANKIFQHRAYGAVPRHYASP
ncbi:hypothetical protein J6590_102179 [Homalodisca vitripennis]|nr:hypothetical protein J6590_102179 [Homalodisca vitripennis]